MHYHVPKPFFRASRKTWYVQLAGKQISLGKDKAQAFQRYYEIMANPPDDRLEKASVGEGSPLANLFDTFLEWVQGHRSEPTYGWYRYRLQRFVDRYPNLTVEALRPFHVQQWADSYADHSQTTTRNYMRSVKRCLKWAQRLGYIDKNPIESLEIPAGEAREVYIPREQFEDFLKFTNEANLKDLLRVTYNCGCRPQESLRLEVRHVDLKHGRWVLPRAEAKGKKAPRVVYLNETALEITKRLIARRESGYVFQNSKGRKWKAMAVNCALQRMRVRIGKLELKRQGIELTEIEIAEQVAKLSPTRRRAGKFLTKTKAELRCEAKSKLMRAKAYLFAPEVSLYSLRHSWATNALQSGVDSLTVAVLMGHQDPSMLAKVYQHLGHNPEHMTSEARKATAP